MTTYPDPGAIGDVVGTSGRIEATWGNAVRDRLVNRFASTAALNAAIPSPTEGMICYVIADGCYYAYSGAAWEVFGYLGALPSYTPVVVQGGVVGVTVNTAKIQRVGRKVDITVNVTCTGTGTGTATSVITVELPYVAATPLAGAGSGFVLDNGVAFVPAIVVPATTTSIQFMDSTVALAGVYLGMTGSSYSGGLGTNDNLNFTYSFEAAS